MHGGTMAHSTKYVTFVIWNYENLVYADMKKHETSVKQVWPDGKIIFQCLAIYIFENLPNGIKICKRGLNILQNTNYGIQKLSNTFKISPHRQKYY